VYTSPLQDSSVLIVQRKTGSCILGFDERNAALHPLTEIGVI